MSTASCREAIREYIREQTRPRDKFSHQERLYAVATKLGELEAIPYDDDVLFAAAWMHDLGVFIGHRPEDPLALPHWDHLGYVIAVAPEILARLGFPAGKISAVLDAIRTHLPTTTPTSYEGTLLRDADILEQLGATGILRTVSKVGRDTRFNLFSDALQVVRRNLKELPFRLQLGSARRLAENRVRVMEQFLDAAEAEAGGIAW